MSEGAGMADVDDQHLCGEWAWAESGNSYMAKGASVVYPISVYVLGEGVELD